MLPTASVESWRKGVAEVGVLGAAAVASPPSGVDGELRQVSKAAELVRAGGLAAGQSAEAIQVHRLAPFEAR